MDKLKVTATRLGPVTLNTVDVAYEGGIKGEGILWTTFHKDDGDVVIKMAYGWLDADLQGIASDTAPLSVDAVTVAGMVLNREEGYLAIAMAGGEKYTHTIPEPDEWEDLVRLTIVSTVKYMDGRFKWAIFKETGSNDQEELAEKSSQMLRRHYLKTNAGIRFAFPDSLNEDNNE